MWVIYLRRLSWDSLWGIEIKLFLGQVSESGIDPWKTFTLDYSESLEVHKAGYGTAIRWKREPLGGRSTLEEIWEFLARKFGRVEDHVRGVSNLLGGGDERIWRVFSLKAMVDLALQEPNSGPNTSVWSGMTPQGFKPLCGVLWRRKYSLEWNYTWGVCLALEMTYTVCSGVVRRRMLTTCLRVVQSQGSFGTALLI